MLKLKMLFSLTEIS